MIPKPLLAAALTAVLLAGCQIVDKEKNADPVPLLQTAGRPHSAETAFTPDQAVAAVLADHPEFPQAGESNPIETMTGGPYPGTKVEGTLFTSVEASSEPERYIVTLAKQWNFSVNDKELKGLWKFEVTPDAVRLLESNDNTDLIHVVK